jgi:hypothetical protein
MGMGEGQVSKRTLAMLVIALLIGRIQNMILMRTVVQKYYTWILNSLVLPGHGNKTKRKGGHIFPL